MALAIDTYVDGELNPSQIVEVEAHLAQCSCCRERVALERATRSSLRRVVPLRAPTSLRERVQATMAAERARREAATLPCGATLCQNDSARVLPFRRPGQAAATEARALTAVPAREVADIVSLAERRSLGPVRARYAVPFAVAAGVAFVVSAPRHTPTAAPEPAAMMSSVHNDVGLDGIVDDLVAQHAQPLPPEVTQPDEVRRFDPFVGVPVEPPKLQTFGAKWEGGRMLPIRDSRAAMLQYSLAGGHRITVYVYDPRRVRGESRTLRQRVVRDAPVYVGNVRGYNIAATERRGVGYAVATDLGEPESAELVAASAF